MARSQRPQAPAPHPGAVCPGRSLVACVGSQGARRLGARAKLVTSGAEPAVSFLDTAAPLTFHIISASAE